MTIRICTYWSVCTLVWMCVAANVSAQVGGAIPEVEAGPQFQESLPPLIYTPDAEGKPSILWTPFPMEAADEMLQRRRLEQAKVIVTNLALEVTAKENRAIIKNTLKLQTLAEGIQRVPIKMGSVTFTSEPTSAEAKVFARAIPGVNEYELIVDGKQDEEITVEFETVAKLTKIGDETHLRISVPRVSRSSLRLTVPIADATAIYL